MYQISMYYKHLIFHFWMSSLKECYPSYDDAQAVCDTLNDDADAHYYYKVEERKSTNE